MSLAERGIRVHAHLHRLRSERRQLARHWTMRLHLRRRSRVRIERLFSNQTRTAVAFLTQMTGNPISYEISRQRYDGQDDRQYEHGHLYEQ
jgi:hypothetical protein